MKERLIGAAVLVAIAVVVVPWVLDGDGERGDEPVPSLELPVPEQPLPLQRQTLNLDDDATLSPPTPAERSAAARAAEPADDDDADTPQAASAAASTTSAAANAAPGTGSAAAAAAVTTPLAQTPAAASAPARETPAPPAAARRDPPAQTAASAAGAWQVQLGSFGEEENARRLVQRVATFGYKAAISNVRSNGRTMYRVRVGPHATRDEASAAASSLSAHGFVAQVVSAD